jgi:cytidine deaminase
MDAEHKNLLAAAEKAASMAYARYSGFRVGAAVLTPGGVFPGANIETASTNLGICAERSAIVNARMDGQTDIIGVAVCCLDIHTDQNAFVDEFAAMPCGACRQWLAEFAPEAWLVINTSDKIFRLNDLLPFAFKLQPPASS